MSDWPFPAPTAEPARRVVVMPRSSRTPLMRAAQEVCDAHLDHDSQLEVLERLIEFGGSDEEFLQVNRDLDAAQARITRAVRELNQMLNGVRQ